MQPQNPDKNRPLYQRVTDDILALIRRGEFSYHLPICTENKLMEQYHISRITARRAMGDLEARGILYRKRGAGSFVTRNALQGEPPAPGAPKLFAFIFPFDLRHYGLGAIFQAANDVLQRGGYMASVHITQGDAYVPDQEYLHQMIGSHTAGVAYYPKPADIHLSLLNRLVFNGKPVVLMDLPSPCRYISSVSSDNFGGIAQLMDYLLALGHRRVAYVTGVLPEARKTLGDRVESYILSLYQAGLPVDADLIITSLTEEFRRSPGSDGSPTQVHATIRSLTARGATAILCEHDQLAFELAVACRELQIKVPEQLSICGFDHSEWANMIPGGITTVEQNMADIGRKTAELLLQGLNDPLSAVQQVVVPTRLIVAGSSGPARREAGAGTEGETV
jgi:DNA-binding LacI/PurR family transcriptional regulator